MPFIFLAALFFRLMLCVASFFTGPVLLSRSPGRPFSSDLVLSQLLDILYVAHPQLCTRSAGLSAQRLLLLFPVPLRRAPPASAGLSAQRRFLLSLLFPVPDGSRALCAVHPSQR